MTGDERYLEVANHYNLVVKSKSKPTEIIPYSARLLEVQQLFSSGKYKKNWVKKCHKLKVLLAPIPPQLEETTPSYNEISASAENIKNRIAVLINAKWDKFKNYDYEGIIACISSPDFNNAYERYMLYCALKKMREVQFNAEESQVIARTRLNETETALRSRIARHVSFSGDTFFAEDVRMSEPHEYTYLPLLTDPIFNSHLNTKIEQSRSLLDNLKKRNLPSKKADQIEFFLKILEHPLLMQAISQKIVRGIGKTKSYDFIRDHLRGNDGPELQKVMLRIIKKEFHKNPDLFYEIPPLDQEQIIFLTRLDAPNQAYLMLLKEGEWLDDIERWQFNSFDKGIQIEDLHSIINRIKIMANVSLLTCDYRWLMMANHFNQLVEAFLRNNCEFHQTENFKSVLDYNKELLSKVNAIYSEDGIYPFWKDECRVIARKLTNEKGHFRTRFELLLKKQENEKESYFSQFESTAEIIAILEDDENFFNFNTFSIVKKYELVMKIKELLKNNLVVKKEANVDHFNESKKDNKKEKEKENEKENDTNFEELKERDFSDSSQLSEGRNVSNRGRSNSFGRSQQESRLAKVSLFKSMDDARAMMDSIKREKMKKDKSEKSGNQEASVSLKHDRKQHLLDLKSMGKSTKIKNENMPERSKQLKALQQMGLNSHKTSKTQSQKEAAEMIGKKNII